MVLLQREKDRHRHQLLPAASGQEVSGVTRAAASFDFGKLTMINHWSLVSLVLRTMSLLHNHHLGLSPLGTIPVGHIGFCAASGFTKEDYPEVDFVAVPTEKDEHHSIEIYQVSDGEPSRLAIVDLTSETESPPIGSPMTCFLTDLAPASAMLLIVGFESGNVRIWRVDAASVRIIAQAKLIQEAVMDMAFDRDRRFGFCVSPEKAVKCWRLVDDNENSSSFRIENSDDIALPRPGASSVRIRDDGKIFAVGGWDGKIRVFACKTQKPLAVLQFHSDTVRCVCFCKGRVDGRRLMAAGSKDGSVSLWNLYSD